MKKLISLLTVFVAVNAFAVDNPQINIETVEPDVASILCANDIDISSQSESDICMMGEMLKIEESPATENNVQIPDELINRTATTLTPTTSLLDQAENFIENVAETVVDICDKELNELFQKIVTDLNSQGLNKDQITSILNALSQIKEQGLSVQQIENLIKSLVTTATQPQTKAAVEGYLKKIFSNPVFTGVSGLLVGAGIAYFIASRCK